jgi:protein-L-isoaspartate O-methyltransferase
VLDIGCGSGYSTAALYELVKDPLKMNEVQVVGIDNEEKLVELSKNNLETNYYE